MMQSQSMLILRFNTSLCLSAVLAVTAKIVNGSSFLPDTAAVTLPGST